MYIAAEEDDCWELKTKVKETKETQQTANWNINGTYIYPVHPYLKNKRKKEPCKPNEGTM